MDQAKASSNSLKEILPQIKSQVQTFINSKLNQLHSEDQTILQLNQSLKETQLQVQKLETQNQVLSQEVSDKTLAETLENYCQLFEKYLGLQFEIRSNELHVCFSYITSQEPTHKVVLTQTNNKYEIQECTPPIPQSQHLLNQLNSTNDFPSFIKQLRKGFLSNT